MTRPNESSLTQLTVRGFGPELGRAVQRLARAEGISLNEAVLRLLRKGAGVGEERRRDEVGDSLDHLAGTWTDEDLHEFEAAVEPLARIDEELWKPEGQPRDVRQSVPRRRAGRR